MLTALSPSNPCAVRVLSLFFFLLLLVYFFFTPLLHNCCRQPDVKIQRVSSTQLIRRHRSLRGERGAGNVAPSASPTPSQDVKRGGRERKITGIVYVFHLLQTPPSQRCSPGNSTQSCTGASLRCKRVRRRWRRRRWSSGVTSVCLSDGGSLLVLSPHQGEGEEGVREGGRERRCGVSSCGWWWWWSWGEGGAHLPQEQQAAATIGAPP